MIEAIASWTFDFSDMSERNPGEPLLTVRRIGAVEEGIFRHHLITDTGRIRDTVYYSIIDRDWPEVKKLLEAKIARPWRDHS